MLETVYTEHLKGRKVLLETPTGFAVFLVKDFVFQKDKNIWVHFSDPEHAIQALAALGFKKVESRSDARKSDSGSQKDLVQLINKFCSIGETLIVQDKELKASIEEKICIKCICDGYAVDEVIWGIKNVLHAFIREEKCNITPEYCIPVSKGLQEALQYYLVNIPPRMVDKTFLIKFGFLCYLDMNLEEFPKELLRSFDKYVGIGDTIKNGLDYTKVLAMVLFPKLVEKYDFSKTFSPELTSKLRQAQLFQAKREDVLTNLDLQKIMGYLDYLLHVPELRRKVLMDVKLLEMTYFESLILQKKGPDARKKDRIGKPVNFNEKVFRSVLLETPSGFVIFNVREDVFSYPENIWPYFTHILDTRRIVFALCFVSVDEKSVTRNCDIGPGDTLEQLILKFCNTERELVVQDTQLKAVIESKLGVKCRTGDEVVDEVIWGLKYVMCEFISEERNKVTDNYFYPLSKQLLKDLKTYGIIVSTDEIAADLICAFGYVRLFDIFLKKTYKALHNICDCYVSEIVVSEDDVTYASMIAKVLVPEFKDEIGLPEISGGFGSNLMDLPKDIRKNIPNCVKQEMKQSLKMISYLCKERECAHQKLQKIEAQIVVARMTVSNEAVGKGDANTKGSNKDGGSAKKCKGKTETMGSNKDGQYANKDTFHEVRRKRDKEKEDNGSNLEGKAESLTISGQFSASGEDIHSEHTEIVMHQNNGSIEKTADFQSNGLPFEHNQYSNGDVSTATKQLDHLTLHEGSKPSNDSIRAVIIPDHLKVSNADCAHLTFGSFVPGMLDASLSTKSLDSHVEVATVPSNHSIDQSDVRIPEDESKVTAAPAANEYVASVTKGNMDNLDATLVQQSEVTRANFMDVTNNNEYNLLSDFDYATSSAVSQDSVSHSYLQENRQLQNISPFSSFMQIHNGLLPPAIPPLPEFNPAFSLLLTNPPTMMHGTASSSMNNVAVSTQPQENVKPVCLPNPQLTQSQPNTSIASEPPLPQHPALHPYAQAATLPLGYAGMIDYPSLPPPPSYACFPPAAFQQPYMNTGLVHQAAAAVPNSSVKYPLPQYKSSASLQQPASLLSSYVGGFGAANNMPGNFPLNQSTASATPTLGSYGSVPQYNDGNQFISPQKRDPCDVDA